MRPITTGLATALILATVSPAAADGRGSDESGTIGYQTASTFFALFLSSRNPFRSPKLEELLWVGESDRRQAVDAERASEALRKTIAAQAKAREYEKAGEDLMEFIDELVRPDDYLPGLDD